MATASSEADCYGGDVDSHYCVIKLIALLLPNLALEITLVVLSCPAIKVLFVDELIV